MSKQLSQSDILSIFGKNVTNVVKKSSNETNKVDPGNESVVLRQYKGANRTLLGRNQELSIQFSDANKKIRQLEEENSRLREKICALESDLLGEGIEIIVAERVQRKLAHYSTLFDKARTCVMQYAEQMGSITTEISAEFPAKNVTHFKGVTSKKPIACKPALDKVEELPIASVRRSRRKTEIFEIQPDPDETPKAERNRRRTVGNTSPDRTPKASPDHNETSDDDLSVYATPLATPSVKKIDETPLPTDTARRKRAAVTKIRSLAEPRLNNKIRRPGKYDEPSPYISV